MSVWRPMFDADGVPLRRWVDQSTGEVRDSLAEVCGLWSLDAGLCGLLAEAEALNDGR